MGSGNVKKVVFSLILIFLLASCDKFDLLTQFPSPGSGATGSSPSTPGVLAISPVVPAVRVGASVNFVASGGSSPYTFDVAAGGAGGTIYPITGVYTAPSVPGSDTVTVTDAVGATADAIVSIVAASQLQISPPSLTLSAGGSYQFSAIGGAGGYSFSLVSGSGTMTAGGLYHAPGSAGSAYVRVTDSVTTTSDASILVVSGGPLSISPGNPQIPENSSITFAGSGGSPPYTFSVYNGSGTINATTGTFMPLGAVGAGAATIRVTDSALNHTDTQVDVIPAAPTSLIVTPASKELDLNWQNNASMSNNIKIERKTGSSGSWAVVATLAGNAVAYQDTGLANKELYVYRVYAVAGGLNSLYSNEAFDVTLP